MPGQDKNKNTQEIDFNKRADGYGSAGAESEHEELPYEKAREEKKSKEAPKAPTQDENGLPNQHGEVDQYTFRDS